MKRFFGIFLVLFAIGSFAYAGGGGQQRGSSYTPIDFPGDWKPTHDYSNHVTITLANVQTIDGYDYSRGDPFASWWADAFNMTLEVTSLTFDNWSEMLRIWAASRDLPDVSIFNYIQGTHADAAGWVEQGLIKRLPNNWRNRWPNVARVFGVTTLGPQTERIFGGTYFLPRSRFEVNLPHHPLPDHVSFFFRKDWAEAVGFPVKDVYTTSEVIQYGNLIRQHDPGNLGARLLPISSRPNWAMRLFILSNFAHFDTFYRDNNGVWQWGPASERTLFGLRLWYQAFASGALNPDFFLLRDLEDYDQFRIAGISGGYYGEATSNHIYVNRRLSFEPNVGLDADVAVGVATVVGEDGYYHLVDLINYWGAHMFNPDISNEKLDRWMDMLDFGSTDAGYHLQNLGFEGIDWRRGPGGELINLLPPGQAVGSAVGKYPSITGNTMAGLKQGDDLSFDHPVRPLADRQDSWRLYQDRARLSTPQTLVEMDWDLFTFDSPNRRRANLDFQVEFANLVTSASSEAHLETLWRQWIASQMPIIQPVLNELNTQLRR